MTELGVPMAVRGLELETPTRVVGPRQDLETLPWFDGERDRNTTTPPLAAAVEAEPFAEHSAWLDPGVHLHWSLPDGLTRGGTTMRPEQPVQVGDLWMPPAPNRWLIKRRRAEEVTRAWIVESDYVHPGTSRPNPSAIAYPRSVRDGTQPPYLFLGRQIELDPDTLAPLAGPAEPYDPDRRLAAHGPALTALGPGDPLFAAHYPTCRSVFGLHDDAPQTSGHVSYEVYGWYHDAALDPLGRFVQALWADPDRARHLLAREAAKAEQDPPFGPDDELSADLWREATVLAVADRFGWDVPGGSSTGTPDSILCYGLTSIWHDSEAEEGTEPAPARPFEPEISLGSNPSEAFVAYITKDHPLEPHDADRLIQAVAGTDLSHHGLDLAAKLEEARHTEQFTAHRGHATWTIRPADHQGDPSADGVRLPPELAEDLNLLNGAQERYDRQLDGADALRQGLFDDWSQYMTALMPEHDAAPFGADIDALRELIERARLRPLEVQLASLGQLLVGRDARGDDVVVDARELVDAGPTPAAPPAGYDDGSPFSDVPPDGGPLVGVNVYYGAIVDDIVPVGPGGRTPRPERSGNLAEIRLHDGEELTALVGDHGLWEWTGQRLILRLSLLTSFGRHFGPFGWTDDPGTPFVVTVPSGTAAAGFVGNASDYVHGLGLLVVPRTPHTAVVTRVDTAAREVVERYRDLRRAITDANAGGAALTLTLTPGPRFYSPHDPVVVIRDHRAQPGRGPLRRGPTGRLECPAFALSPGWANTGDAFAGNRRAPLGHEAVWDEHDDQIWTRAVSEPDDWHPIEIEWQAEVAALSEGANHDGRRYDPAFVVASERLPDDHMDLVPAGAAPPLRRTYEYVAGRAVLNPSAGRRLTERARGLADGVVPTAAAGLISPTGIEPIVLPLGGFHDQLLMRHNVPQLPIDDPTALPAGRAFTGRVREAAGTFHPTSPAPDAAFHPIRSGEVIVQQLRLIDAFGRTLAWKPPVVHTTKRMTPAGGDVDRLRLPVRFSQPARLDFRWLSAAHHDVESGLHPAASPVAGWVVADELDGAVAVYGAAGMFLGTVDASARWSPAPGDPTAPRSEREIGDRAVARLVRWLTAAGDPSLVAAFVGLLDQALAQIDPLDAAQHQARALLVGRPVALVRARLGLRLQHGPAEDQSLRAIRARLDGHPPDTHGAEHVRIPVRLGEHGHLSDGLCGYWIEGEAGAPLGRLHTAPGLSLLSGHDGIDTPSGEASDGLPLRLSVAGGPHELTMLIDPRGTVHATTGILPVKGVRLPPEFYREQLSHLRVTFPVGPLLSPPDRVEIPLPAEPGFSWSWLALTGEGWTEVPHHPTITRSDVIEAFGPAGAGLWDRLIVTGEIVADPGAGTGIGSEGRMMPASADAAADRFADLGLTVDVVSRGLHALARSIDRVVETARYDVGRAEAVEGWLQLRPTPRPPSSPGGSASINEPTS